MHVDAFNNIFIRRTKEDYQEEYSISIFIQLKSFNNKYIVSNIFKDQIKKE